jgi:hypothetical protein
MNKRNKYAVSTHHKIGKLWLNKNKDKCDELFDKMVKYTKDNNMNYDIYCCYDTKYENVDLLDESMRNAFYEFCKNNTI